MSNEIGFKFTGESSSVENAQEKVARGADEIKTGYREAAKAARELEQSQKFVDKLERLSAAPIDRVTDAQRRLNVAMQQGLIDQHKADQLLAGVQARAKPRESSFDFGAMVSGAMQLATAYVSVSQAVGLVTSAFQQMRQAEDAAADRAKQSSVGLAGLSQVADLDGGNEDYTTLTNAARKVYESGGTKTLGEAADLIFNLKSGGMFEDRGLFADLSSKMKLQDITSFAGDVATIRANFGGEGKTSEEIISGAFGAGTGSIRNVQKLMGTASRAAVPAKQAGVDSSEVFAASAVLTTSTGHMEMAGTQLASLLRAFGNDQQFAGKSLEQAVEHTESLNLEAEELQKLLGSSEAVTAFVSLRDGMEAYRKNLAKTIDAISTHETFARMALPESDASIAAVQLVDREKARFELQQEPTGTFQNTLDAYLLARKRDIASRRGNLFANTDAIFQLLSPLPARERLLQYIGDENQTESLIASGNIRRDSMAAADLKVGPTALGFRDDIVRALADDLLRAAAAQKEAANALEESAQTQREAAAELAEAQNSNAAAQRAALNVLDN